MPEQTEIRRYSFINLRVILLIMAALAAHASNPDDESFKRFIKRRARQSADGLVEKVASHFLSEATLTVLDWERIDYGFFSVVVFPDFGIAFVGVFGTWMEIDFSDAPDIPRKQGEN